MTRRSMFHEPTVGEGFPLRPSPEVSIDPFERGHPATPWKRRAAGGRARSRRFTSGSYGSAPDGRPQAPPAARRRVPPGLQPGSLQPSFLFA